MAPNETENHDFQAEVKQLLDLMIHSLYSNTEVFLRELISNASDALDRRRFDGLTHPELIPDEPLGIALRVDPENRTLTVSDNGIGMSREEVIANIGTIAKSGTAEFAHALRDRKGSEIPPELIGQFGVGFYASFMVADRVTVVTRSVVPTKRRPPSIAEAPGATKASPATREGTVAAGAVIVIVECCSGSGTIPAITEAPSRGIHSRAPWVP